MMKRKLQLTMDGFEQRVLVSALNDLRNQLIASGKDHLFVDELMLRVIDAPAKRLFGRCAK